MTINLGDKVRYIGTLLLAMALAGCAAHKPVTHAPVQLHLGPEHVECDQSGNCEWVQNWLTPGNKPVLSPLGCALAKARVTWIFGDKPSMCPQKWYVKP